MEIKSQYPISKTLLFYAGWCLFWTLTQTIVLHRLNWSWEISFIDASVSNLLLTTFGYVTSTIYRFYQPNSSSRFFRLIFGLTMAFIFCELVVWILSTLFSTDLTYVAFLEKSIPVRFVFALLLIAFITLFNWLSSYLIEQKESEKRKFEAEQFAKQAELDKIRQQLQPHFLFNSLNSVYSLVNTKPLEARKMILQLSDFLRGTLKNDQSFVLLSDELEYVKLYLEIEKVRFGDRLNIHFEIEQACLSINIPPLLLQPIVENAIKFGLYDITEPVFIQISASMVNNLLEITVSNPFDAKTMSASQGAKFGLHSINRRLYLIYTRNDLLTTQATENTFTTTLKIPLVQ